MTCTSERATRRPATRARGRQHKEVRHVRRPRETKRLVYEEASTSGDFAGICGEQDVHLTIANRFSILDSELSKRSQSTRSVPSSFISSLMDPCGSSAKNLSIPPLPPCTPTTSPSHPTVKPPDTDSHNGRKLVQSGLRPHCSSNNNCHKLQQDPQGLLPDPSPFLNDRDTRDILRLTHGSDHKVTSFSSVAFGRGGRDLNFQGHRVDLPRLDVGVCHPPTDWHSRPMAGDEYSFIGAALPDMNKTVTRQPAIVGSLDVNFSRCTGSYLLHARRSTEHRSTSNGTTAFGTGCSAWETKNLRPLVVLTSNSFPRLLQTLPPALPAPYLDAAPPVPSSTSKHEVDVRWDNKGMWEPVISHRVELHTSMQGLDSAKLIMSPVFERRPRPRWKNTADGCMRRSTETDLHAQRMWSEPTISAAASGTISAVNSFRETRDKKPVDLPPMSDLADLFMETDAHQGNDSQSGSPTQVPDQTCRSAWGSPRQSAIANAAIPPATSPNTLLERCGIHMVAPEPSSASKALVPSMLHEHQYLGWPTCKTGEDIVYQDKAWPTVGAHISHLHKDLVGDGPTTAVAVKQVTCPCEGMHKVVHNATGHLEMYMDNDNDAHLANAGLLALSSQSDFSATISDYGVHHMSDEATQSRVVKDSVEQDLANIAASGGDLTSSLGEEMEESRSSGASWSEIGNEIDSDESWNWSDKDLEAGHEKHD